MVEKLLIVNMRLKMSNKIIKRKQDETGISKSKLVKLWEQAQAITAKKNLSGDSFFKMLNSIFEELVKNMVKKESIELDSDDVICEFLEYLDEETVSGDVDQGDYKLEPDSMVFRKPCFHVDDDLFFKVGFCNRKKRGWRNKFYGTKMGDWSRKHKNQDFYIKNIEKDLLMHVNRDRHIPKI